MNLDAVRLIDWVELVVLLMIILLMAFSAWITDGRFTKLRQEIRSDIESYGFVTIEECRVAHANTQSVSKKVEELEERVDRLEEGR